MGSLVDVNGTTVANGSTPAVLSNIPTAASGATGNAWLPVKVAGTLSYIPIWR